MSFARGLSILLIFSRTSFCFMNFLFCFFVFIFIAFCSYLTFFLMLALELFCSSFSSFFSFSLFLSFRFYFLFRVKEEGRKKGRERNINVREKNQSVASRTCPNQGRNRNPSMCPDQESNWRPLALWNDAQLSHTSQGLFPVS